MGENTITMFNEEFENGETGEKVRGITIIIDGKLRQVVELLMQDSEYTDYPEVIRDALFAGISAMIAGKKNARQE